MPKKKKIEIYLEEFCAFESECALVVARDFRGNFLSYPLFFTQQDNGICSWVWGPAQAFDPALKNVEQEARELARTFLDKIDYVGVMAFEFFLTKEKKLLLNEVAPRVHNSGHLTLEAFDLDQFSLHCMAIRGFEKNQLQPLSKVYLMKNLLGTSEGSSSWKAQVLKRETSTAYWYGKQTLRKGRKHGHLTCLFDNPEDIQKYKNQLNESAQNLWQEVQLSIKI